MKPTVTWVVLANAHAARVFVHRRAGRGLEEVSGRRWSSPEQLCAQSSTRDFMEWQFAKDITACLSEDLEANHFDQMILVSGPRMLGLMRKHLSGPLHAALSGEIAKDLSHRPIRDVEFHLGELVTI